MNWSAGDWSTCQSDHHSHIGDPGTCRAIGRDRGGVDDGDVRRRRRAEVDHRRAGEAGAGNRHQRAAGRRAAVRVDCGDLRYRRHGVRELIGGRCCRRAAGLITVTFTMPVPAGLSAVMVVSLTTVTSVAAVVPKSTAVASVKPVPVIVTNVPPAAGRCSG